MATSPAPPPRPADDVIQDLQRSGWSRWTPRRTGAVPLAGLAWVFVSPPPVLGPTSASSLSAPWIRRRSAGGDSRSGSAR
jgi:hypothetical protein